MTGADRKAVMLRMKLPGIGAMASPRYRPAGLLVEYGKVRVMIDGGPGALAAGPLDAWLLTDEHNELMAAIRRLAKRRGITPMVGRFAHRRLSIEPRRVIHTSHPAFGYLIRALRKLVVWAPEFYRFPRWAHGADVMFAEAASWSRPIRFRGGVGGHAAVLDVAKSARKAAVRRLVFAHVGRPTNMTDIEAAVDAIVARISSGATSFRRTRAIGGVRPKFVRSLTRQWEARPGRQRKRRLVGHMGARRPIESIRWSKLGNPSQVLLLTIFRWL